MVKFQATFAHFNRRLSSLFNPNFGISCVGVVTASLVTPFTTGLCKFVPKIYLYLDVLSFLMFQTRRLISSDRNLKFDPEIDVSKIKIVTEEKKDDWIRES